ncbi:uncharacterized protein LOC128722650 [Anopheles nili]|uniref:uncharacterized protein LOC128722650 n=1 Tax=Anopheles nili TaxID=185578 RepID=UPI00237C36C6|nr:uncharacterized protein LOC128722650 [Anopheles nili]
MAKFVFVVLSALLVGGALGEAALGNYYKDVVREQHELINEMNQNFTELEKASEKLIDLGVYVGKHKLPPKTVKITKTVAVKVPVPFPVRVPEPVPVPVPVAKPVPVPVPTLVAIPVEGSASPTATATTGTTGTGSPSPTAAGTGPDAAPASSQAHPSTVQLQEYVHSFPIHSVYDAGDDYNPMEGNRLALAKHTASPTESTFSKPSPSSLQQLEEYQQQHQHQRPSHGPSQPKHSRPKPAQAGSGPGAEQYYAGTGQYYVGGAQVQTGAHTAAKLGPQSHARPASTESYGYGGGQIRQHHPTALTRTPDTVYTAAAGFTGGESASVTAPAGSTGYRFTSGQQLQRGQPGTAAAFSVEQYGRGGGGGGERGGSGVTGITGGGRGGARGGGSGGGGRGEGQRVGGGLTIGVGRAPETEAEVVSQSYHKYAEAAVIQIPNGHHEAAKILPHFESESEAQLEGQTSGQRNTQGGPENDDDNDDAKTQALHDLTPRPFQLVRESYARYEKPTFGRYQADTHHHEHTVRTPHHQHFRQHTERPHEATGETSSGSGTSGIPSFDHAPFAQPGGTTGAGGTAELSSTTETHGYTVPGERPFYSSLPATGYHHTHSHHKDTPGRQTGQDLRHQTIDDGGAIGGAGSGTGGAGGTGSGSAVEPFPFYQATKDDPHLARGSLQSLHTNIAASGATYQLEQQFGGHEESSSQSGHREHHQSAGHHHHHHREHAGSKYAPNYGTKSALYSVPSDAHLFPDYNPNGGGHDDGAGGKFHYHFHNVHPVGGGADHHEPAASEHQYTVHAVQPGEQYDVTGSDGSLLSSYDPPASGNTFHFHDDDGAGGTRGHFRAPYGEVGSYEHVLTP